MANGTLLYRREMDGEADVFMVALESLSWIYVVAIVVGKWLTRFPVGLQARETLYCMR